MIAMKTAAATELRQMDFAWARLKIWKSQTMSLWDRVEYAAS